MNYSNKVRHFVLDKYEKWPLYLKFSLKKHQISVTLLNNMLSLHVQILV